MTVQQTLAEIARFHSILAEGRRGIHLLFRPELIRTAMGRNPVDLQKILQERLNDVNEAVNQAFTIDSLQEKQNFIEALPTDIRDALIFGYFQMLEGDTGTEKSIN